MHFTQAIYSVSRRVVLQYAEVNCDHTKALYHCGHIEKRWASDRRTPTNALYRPMQGEKHCTTFEPRLNHFSLETSFCSLSARFD